MASKKLAKAKNPGADGAVLQALTDVKAAKAILVGDEQALSVAIQAAGMKVGDILHHDGRIRRVERIPLGTGVNKYLMIDIGPVPGE